MSKSYVQADSSAQTLSEQAQLFRLGEGAYSKVKLTTRTSDFGAIQGGLDLGSKLIDVVGKIASDAGSLSRSSADATRAAALETTERLDAAYSKATGTVNATTVVVVVVIIVAVTAVLMRGGK